ncbi:response regulator transcription factor [Enterococcus sp. LJL51]|uniref:response regulator transcription factor n=1 Tax=Enterococcus sp. LJL51 TaxID=3416656 RepID=UPI003CF0CBF3
MTKNILIVDDDKELCQLLKRQLQLEGYHAVVSYAGQEGLTAFRKGRFSLVLLDVMLPDKSGFELLTEIRKTSTVPVLMLTARDSEIDKVSGLRMGADDYLTKPFLLNELIARVQSMIRRYTVFSQPDEGEQLHFPGLILDYSKRQAKLNDSLLRLTAKEFELLYFLASEQGRVYTKEQIYTYVWKGTYAYDDSNIMSFISKLRKKIRNEQLQLDYIETVHGIGYRFNPEV